jgi:predicted lipoprotein with Yx(FWY)xxD motif
MILVNSRGMTVYYLTGETASHLLCTTKACLKFWPPVDLPSGATAPAAIKGVPMSKLGTIKRDGKLQATYNGWPLYTFAGDTQAGQDKGENIKSDGGTWLVIQSPASSSTSTTTAPPATSSGSSSSGGGWS